LLGKRTEQPNELGNRHARTKAKRVEPDKAASNYSRVAWDQSLGPGCVAHVFQA
jgi:hypothetical protein